MTKQVVVVIPSLNSPLIAQVVTAVLSLPEAGFIQKVVVVGKDEAGAVPTSDRVQFVDTGQPVLAAAARNTGTSVTDADLIIYLDSDCIPEPGWLAGHLAAHQEGYRVVSGSVLLEGRNYWHLVYNLTLFHELLPSAPRGPRDYLATLNLSVDRAVIDQVGGMDERVNRVEDVDWTTRMRRVGIQPYFWPKAAIRHEHGRTTFRQVWRDCALSGYHMRRLRLHHADLLQAPGVLRYPRLVLLLSPFVAAWATMRIMWRQPALVYRFWHVWPGVFLTKIAWCWGAAQKREPG
ncbi:MAG: glycosyltransferase [Anaerolineae bacterium]|nr:glycosyltransferase [Anaerolineae bacterium]